MGKTLGPTRRRLDDCLIQIERGRRATREMLMESSDTPADLTAALLDAVALFESLGIDYALIGGLAAMVHGRQRFTEDVDFIAEADHESTLQESADAMRQHHFDPCCTWKLYHKSGIEIDLWKDEHVAAMLDRAVTTELAGRAVRVVDATDLAAMKLRADRPQDDYDISEMIKADAIDETALVERVTPEQMGRYRTIHQRTHSE